MIQTRHSNHPEPLKKPALFLYAFFSPEGEAEAKTWGTKLAELLDDTTLRQTKAQRALDSPAGEPYCELYQQGEAWVVYASLDWADQTRQPITIWKRLAQKIFAKWAELSQALPTTDWRKRNDIFWGMTILFTAESYTQIALPHTPIATSWLKRWLDWLRDWNPEPKISANQAKNWFAEIPALLGMPTLAPLRASPQAWGMLWQLIEDSPDADARQSPHVYAALCNPQQSPVRNHFLAHKTNFDLIELSLHKSYQQIKQSEATRQELYDLTEQLNQTLTTLRATSTPTQATLQTLSQQYSQLEEAATRVTDTHNTISINLQNYHQTSERLELLRPSDQVFSRHLQRVQQGKRQLEVNQIYYQAAIRRAQITLQSTQAALDAALLAEEKRENELSQRREIIFTVIGILLSITQIWPLFDQALELWAPKSVQITTWRMWLNGGIFVILLCAIPPFLTYALRPQKKRHIFLHSLPLLLFLLYLFTQLGQFLLQQWNNLP